MVRDKAQLPHKYSIFNTNIQSIIVFYRTPKIFRAGFLKLGITDILDQIDHNTHWNSDAGSLAHSAGPRPLASKPFPACLHLSSQQFKLLQQECPSLLLPS